MKPGRASQTAVLVCAARAMAHEGALARGFSDETALRLLPEDARAMVEGYRAGRPKGVRAGFRYEFTKARALMMAVRTMIVDDAVRAAHAPQVVILGAGLDGRAWRMPELGDAIVFEVDHPDTQREKRARIASLEQKAREVRLVPVDFTRDDLDERLAAAGHDPTRQTMWIWEGVVMYLTPADVEATLRVIRARSTPGRRLVIVYVAPGNMILPVVAFVVRRLGEPFRSRYRAPEMRALLARHGFDVTIDETLPESAARVAPAIAKAARRVAHMRTVIATSASRRS